ncbi:MAG TPA: cytochrome c [Pyrinomonadaceae bacterium]|nr:cytochrome c [Pyrinomonadaceae bacterium]
MKALAYALFIVAASLVLGACSKPPADEPVTRNGPMNTPSPAVNMDEFASTRAIFKKNCEGCHSEDGSGGLKTVDGKKLKVPNLREGHAVNHPDEDFLKQIQKGGDGMPAFKDKLTAVEMNDLIKFIRKEFQGK